MVFGAPVKQGCRKKDLEVICNISQPGPSALCVYLRVTLLLAMPHYQLPLACPNYWTGTEDISDVHVDMNALLSRIIYQSHMNYFAPK